MMQSKPFRVGRARTGLGLFAIEPIKKRGYIVEYKGRRIHTTKATEHEVDWGGKYMFELNRNWTIDGTTRRNLGRYVNHSCRPNADADVEKGKLIIRARKAIKLGEEITLDYGKDYFDMFIKPVGCRCDKCKEKKRKARAEKRTLAARGTASKRSKTRPKARSKTRKSSRARA
jgi:SET domain-containing protein